MSSTLVVKVEPSANVSGQIESMRMAVYILGGVGEGNGHENVDDGYRVEGDEGYCG